MRTPRQRIIQFWVRSIAVAVALAVGIAAGLVIAQSILYEREIGVTIEPAPTESPDNGDDESDDEADDEGDNESDEPVTLEVVKDAPEHLTFPANDVSGEFEVVLRNPSDRHVSARWTLDLPENNNFLMEPESFMMEFPAGATRTATFTIASQTPSLAPAEDTVRLTLTEQ